MNTFGRAIKSKKEELVLSIALIIILLIISSSAMYFVENQAQPDNFSSIPAAMWWGIATLTTVGYGDVYPITAIGKILGGVIALLGIAMFALPTGIISSALIEEMQKKHKLKSICPHCGKEIE
jgi:voltage-gated potassium channel